MIHIGFGCSCPLTRCYCIEWMKLHIRRIKKNQQRDVFKHDFKSWTYKSLNAFIYIFGFFLWLLLYSIEFSNNGNFWIRSKRRKKNIWRSQTFYYQSDANKSTRMRLRFIDLLKHFQLFIHGFCRSKLHIKHRQQRMNNNTSS